MEFQAENHALKWFIANRDADYVRKATKGLGTNDDLLVHTLCKRTKAQLDRVSAAYKAKYEVSLKKILKRECSGNYAKLVIYSQMKKSKFDALMMYEAMHGMGTNQSLLVEVCTTRTNEQLAAMKTYFEAKYDRSLVDWVRSETSGDFEKTLVKLLTQPRAEDGPVDQAQADAQALRLYAAGKGKRFGTDEDVFIEILAGSSRTQIQAIKASYERQKGHSLESAIKSEMSGHLEDVMLALLDMPQDYFARALKKAFAGLGTDNGAVARILGGSTKEDAIALAARYEEKYGKTLVHDLKDELSGHFKDAAVAWVSAVDPTGGLEPITEGANPTAEALTQENENLKQFIAECDSADIRRACKGLGTDDTALVKVVCGRSKTQLARIDTVYRREHGMSLKKQIKKECSGNYAKMVRYALQKKHKFDAELLYDAMHGLGTNDNLLIEVMTTRSNAEIAAAKTYFEAKRDRSLTDFMSSETSGDYRKTLLRLLNTPRDESEEVNTAQAAEQAGRLYAAGKGKTFGTDEDVFIEILTSASRNQIQEIKRQYEAARGHSLEQAVKDETSGDFEKILLALLELPVDHFARSLKRAFAGLGTDNGAVARILGGNDKAMVERIAARYEEKYGKSLVSELASELSGNFKKAAVMWVAGGAPSELVGSTREAAGTGAGAEGGAGEGKAAEEEEEEAATPAVVMPPPAPGQPLVPAGPAQVYGGPVMPVMAQPLYINGMPVFMPPPPTVFHNAHAGSGMIVLRLA